MFLVAPSLQIQKQCILSLEVLAADKLLENKTVYTNVYNKSNRVFFIDLHKISYPFVFLKMPPCQY